MTSTLFICPAEESFDWEESWVHFGQPVKGVFGRILCDTDGSIGDPSEFSADTAFEILAECERIPSSSLYRTDAKKLRQVRMWAEEGRRLYAVWRH